MENRNNIDAVVKAIDGQRLWRRHQEIARFGATGRGGVNRQALTREDVDAHRLVLGWARARGFSISADLIGNVFIRRAGADESATPIMAGSHLDTQPTGGNFDGVFGVLAAFEVLEAIEQVGVATNRPIEAAIWNNEEGSRFQPATMGSAVHAGRFPLETALDTMDANGIRLGDALGEMLSRLGIEKRRELRSPIAAYVEAHIEQGPALEAANKPIGVVTGIQGLKQFRVEVQGEEAHAGTTPRRLRRDALASAVAMVNTLNARMADNEDILRFTVGRMEVSPNSPNTIPSRTVFTIDLRHPERRMLDDCARAIELECRRNAGRCDVGVTEILDSPPVIFNPAVVNLVREAAERQSLSSMEIMSGATHDAKFMAELCPTAMIFIPCRAGISHNERESASPSDIAAGASVLAEAVMRLANR